MKVGVKNQVIYFVLCVVGGDDGVGLYMCDVGGDYVDVFVCECWVIVV